MEIKTNRLRLRNFTLEDTYDVFEYSKNPNVANPAAWVVHPNMDYSRIIVEKFIRNKEIAIEYKDHVIGSIGIFNPVNESLCGKEISYALKEEYWHQGLMQEALNFAIPYIFETYAIDTIYCCNFIDNLASKKTCESIGFQYLEEYLYPHTPATVAKKVRYYELKKENFFNFKYTFDLNEYILFRNLVKFPEVTNIQAEKIIKNSEYKISLWNQNQIVGMARSISDEANIYLICDVMIHPDFQGRHLGEKLLQHFISYLKYKIGSQYARIYIMALKGKEGFYKKLGFKEDYATGLTIEIRGEQ